MTGQDEQLFAVYIGGSVEGCHLELHDLRFAAGRAIEDCYDALRAQWWGTPKSLHLDAWGVIDWADGHDVRFSTTPPPAKAPRLFLVHLGGYDPALFTERHENFFMVAEDARAAKARAMAKIDTWRSPHRDAVVDIDAAIDVAATLEPGRYLTLTPAPRPRPFRFEARYVPIGR